VTEKTSSPAAVEPFAEHAVRMLVAPEMLAELLRLPDGASIYDIELKTLPGDMRPTVNLWVHLNAPVRAVAMEPVYHRSTAWPDPIHLHDVGWIDNAGKRIGGEVEPLPRVDDRGHRAEQHAASTAPVRPAPAGPPILTPVDEVRPSVGLDRCPHVLVFEPERNQPDQQCALYAGHLERHETQPIAPIREDKADGVHMFLWTTDPLGNVTEINEQRIDDDPDETLGELDV
jgi:hypothetical protein